jgi:Cu2+-exporting ATPase
MMHCCQCNAPVGETADRFVTSADGRALPVCCPCCERAAGGLIQAGLAPAAGAPADIEPRWRRYDLPAVQQQVTHSGTGAGEKEASLFAEAIHCASCSLAIERALKSLDGLVDLDVNVTARRVRVRWDTRRVTLGRILQHMDSIGFSAVPRTPGDDTSTRENRAALKRLLVAGLGSGALTLSVPGTYTRTAAYGGDATYAPSSASGTHTVETSSNDLYLPLVMR